VDLFSRFEGILAKKKRKYKLQLLIKWIYFRDSQLFASKISHRE